PVGLGRHHRRYEDHANYNQNKTQRVPHQNPPDCRKMVSRLLKCANDEAAITVEKWNDRDPCACDPGTVVFRRAPVVEALDKNAAGKSRGTVGGNGGSRAEPSIRLWLKSPE